MRRSGHKVDFTDLYSSEYIKTCRAKINALELPGRIDAPFQGVSSSFGSLLDDTTVAALSRAKGSLRPSLDDAEGVFSGGASSVGSPYLAGAPYRGASPSSGAVLDGASYGSPSHGVVSSTEGALSKGRELTEDVVVLASQINACEEGVPEDVRKLVHSALLIAQLAARQKSPDNAEGYWGKYWQSLLDIGWVDGGINEVTRTIVERNVIVHEQIESILAECVPGFKTPTMVLNLFKSLKGINPDADTSWIKLFHKSAKKISGASFQFSETKMGPDDVIVMDLVDIFLDANAACLQVLFFKSLGVDASLRVVRRRLETTKDFLTKLAETIEEKAIPYYAEEIASILNQKR